MKKIILVIVVIFATNYSFTQSTNREQLLDCNFNGSTIEEFVKSIENQTNFTFYYEDSLFKDIKVSYKANQQKLDMVLRQSLEPLNIYFTFYKNHTVILTRDYKIQKELIYVHKEDIESEDVIVNYSNVREDLSEDLIQYQVINIGQRFGKFENGKAVITGLIKDKNSGSPIPNAVVYVDELMIGTASDLDGKYTLKIDPGNYTLKYRSMGWKEIQRQVNVISSGSLNIDLNEAQVDIEEVVVSANRDDRLKRTVVGLEKLSLKTIEILPTSMGEVDILHSTLALPGVNSTGEGSAGINVRGGTADQNLIMMYDVPFFNSYHFFGFFSAINPEMVSGVSLYKGGIPASYGGRISSIVDIETKVGNYKKYSVKGGISPITGNLFAEGPIIKDKLSFILSGRSTYSNWVLNLIDDPDIQNSSASFYDLNLKLNWKISKEKSVEFAGYMGHDDFKFSFDTSYQYNTNLASLKFKNYKESGFNSIYSLNYSDYKYYIRSEEHPIYAFEFQHKVGYYELKADYQYPFRDRHDFRFGLNVNYYSINPGKRSPFSNESIIQYQNIEDEQALLPNLYLEDEIKLTDKLSAMLGIRLSSIINIGEKSEYKYNEDLGRLEEYITDTVNYKSGEIFNSNWGPEYRVSFNYSLNQANSIKLNYNRTRQYIQMLSNSVAVSPTSIWKLSDSYIKPLIGDQIAVGYYSELSKGMYEFNIDAYYKKMQNVIDYTVGAKIEMNDLIETSILTGEGKAYGIELMLKKKTGRLNGWLNYTYSRSFIRTNDPDNSEVINNGEYYPAYSDQPHDLNIVLNYKMNRRFSVSSNFTYTTGRPTTYPVAVYFLNNVKLIEYSDRNEYRIPDYMRWDIAINMKSNLKKSKWFHSSWTISVYNVLGRNNAYSVFYRKESEELVGYQLSIYSQPIPTITYKFNF